MTSPVASHAPETQSGITLVEVLAVLVIIALATTLTLPRIISNSSAGNLDWTAERLVADLRRSNIEARSQARAVVVEIGEGGYAIDAISIRRAWGGEVSASWQQRGRDDWLEMSRLELTGRTLGREEVRIRLRRDRHVRDIVIEPLTGRVMLVQD